MGNINIDDIESGMVLDGDVKDRTGHVLLVAGTTITDKHIRIFKMWGITDAEIKGVDKEEVVAKAAAQIDPALLADAETRNTELFRHTNLKHPVVEELFRLTTLRNARHSMEEKGNVG